MVYSPDPWSRHRVFLVPIYKDRIQAGALCGHCFNGSTVCLRIGHVGRTVIHNISQNVKNDRISKAKRNPSSGINHQCSFSLFQNLKRIT